MELIPAESSAPLPGKPGPIALLAPPPLTPLSPLQQ